jgi:hypothetical protein
VNRLSRVLVLLSLLAAMALEVQLAAREYGPLLRYVQVAFVVGLLTASRFPLPPISLGIGLAYAAPVLLSVTIGRYRLPYLLIWIAFLTGGMAGSKPLRGWGLPSPWRWPLVTWALIVAAAWPVIVWRETDFDFGTLTNYRLLNTSRGIPPPIAVLGILDAAITHLLGLLWFDWLHTHIGIGSLERFNRVVAIPLGISAFLACLLGAYQGTIDLEFWTSGNWHVLKRAAGSMLDGNVSGMVAACWVPAFIALGLQRDVPYRRLAAAGSGLALVAVWASGSRTALLAALFGAMWVVAVIARRLEGRSKRWAFAAAAGCVVVGIVIASALPLRTIGPIERLRVGLGATSGNGLRAVVTSLWTRDGYGSASTQAIREAPLVGVGVGAFTMLSLDYAVIATKAPVDYDNAQNWFRHQLAELGLLGSVGWIVWVVAFATVLMRRTPSGANEIPAAAVKGAILGLTAASLLGVPTQSTAMTLTFWTFAFWYLVLAASVQAGATVAAPVSGNRERLGWALAVLLTCTHFAGTLHAARTQFSVPQRADRRGWNYEHGFYEPRSVDGRTFRYTHQRSAAVIGKAGRILHLRVWTDDPSAASDPVAAKVWIDGRVILDTRLSYGMPVAMRLPMLVDQEKLLIRTWVARTWRQQPDGEAPRDVGLAVDWTFDN